MTLAFSTKLNGKLSYFIEKIWTGLPWDLSPDYYTYRDEYFEKFGDYWDAAWTDTTESNFAPKLHTIRNDDHSRWREGMKIHPVVNNRTANRYQFTPVLECKSIQSVSIKNRNDLPMTSDVQRYGYRIKVTVKDIDFYNFYQVSIDGRLLDGHEIEKLAINDGFENAEAFFEYFNKDFTGKIIHWTNLKY